MTEVCLWLVFLVGFRLLAAVVSFKLFGDQSRGLGSLLLLFLWALGYWYLGHLFPLSPPFIFAILSLIAAAGLLGMGAGGNLSAYRQKADRAEVIIFWGFWGLGAVIRMWFPEIDFGEKYADMAIFNGLLSASQFPPQDLWLAGEYINYYYFGQLLFVPPALLLHTAPEYAFNLAVVSVFAWGGSTLYSALRFLGLRRVAGISGAVLLMLASNWEWLRWWMGMGINKTRGFWWWDSSRAIENTITEFPYFSFLLGDFHAHFIALPFLSLTLALLLRLRARLPETKRDPNLSKFYTQLKSLFAKQSAIDGRTWFYVLLLGLVLGGQYMLNPWQLPLVALLTVLMLWPMGRLGLVLALVGVLSALPFVFNYMSPKVAGGLFWVPRGHRSAVFEFVLHWAPFLFLALTYSIMQIVTDLRVSERLQSCLRFGRNPKFWRAYGFPAVFGLALFIGLGFQAPALVVLIMAFAFPMVCLVRRAQTELALILVVGVLAIVFVEFFSLDRTYGQKLIRLNTVFKFYMVAWWALCMVCVGIWDRQLEWARFTKVPVYLRYLSFGILLVGLGLSSVYTVKGFWSRAGSLNFSRASLDGMRHWAQEFPGERALIDWMREHTGKNDVIWEMHGEEGYRQVSRISTFSGRPSVVGWLNHEQVWRPNGYPLAHTRIAQIKELSREPQLSALRDFLRTYQVRWMVLGNLEKQNYSIDLQMLIQRYPVVFRNQQVSLHQVNEGKP